MAFGSNEKQKKKPEIEKKKKAVSKVSSTKEQRSPERRNQKNTAEMSKKELRRRRRIRNQTICYTVMVLVVSCIVFFGAWGAKQIINGFKPNKYNINTGISVESTVEDNVLDDSGEIVDEFESEEETVEYVRDELDDVVDAYLADMTLEDKVAQMFIITPESLAGVPGPATLAGAKTEAALQKTAIGGVLFQTKNFTDATKAREMITKTYALGTKPLFTTVFEPGGGKGAFTSNSALGATPTDSFATIGASGDPTLAYNAGATIGGYLSSNGVMLNLSGVADLGTEESFGSDPQLVSDMVSNYVAGMESTGVNVCLTHFPGNSQMTGDIASGKTYTEMTLDEMRTSSFLPFKAGIDAGADFVMVGNIQAMNVTNDTTPSCLSDIIVTDVLRNELGFRGVIITDRLDSSYITQDFSVEDVTLRAVNAGVDILLCPADFDTAYNALLSAVRDGYISEDRINESLHRIYRVKLSGTVQ